MANCKRCGRPVMNGFVIHRECWSDMSWRDAYDFLPVLNHIGRGEDGYKWFYSDEVLVYSTYNPKEPYIFIGILVSDENGDGWLDRHGSVIRGVTHWMPLPEPPKGVE